jgi:hypothetical protein
MRWLSLVAFAACSSTSSTNGIDAGAADARQFHDARSDGPLPPDAYAPRPCDAPATFADGFVPTRVLHVAAGASDGDGSVEHPFGTIAQAAAVATPGTFIQVEPAQGGRLHATNQFISNLTGTADAPIVIGGVWNTLPTLSNGSEAIHLMNPHYVVIQNLEIAAHSANGIMIDDGLAHAGDAGPVAIVNVNIHDTSGIDSSCIRAAGVRGLYIYDSWLRRCTTAIDAIGVHDSVIARTIIQTMSNAGVRVRGGSTDVDVRQNVVADAQGTAISLGGVTPLSQFHPPLSTTTANAEARRVRAFNNLVTGDTSAALTFDGCVDCLVAHNVVFGNENRIVRILNTTSSQGDYAFDSSRNGRVINNSFTWAQLFLTAYVDVGLGASASTFTFSHNLWNNRDSPSSSQPQLPVVEDGEVFNMGTGYAPGTAPPFLYQYCGGPEASRAASLPEVDSTFEGYCRSAGDAPTIGPQMLQLGGCTI